MTDSKFLEYNPYMSGLERQSAEQHKKIILENLNDYLQILEDGIHRFIDPSEINPQTVFDYFVQKERIATLDKMLPQNYLESINRFEKWYKDKKLPIPNSKWVEEVRTFWQSKISK